MASPATIAAATATFNDRIGGFKGMTRRASAAAWTFAGTPAELAAEKQDIAGSITEGRVGQASLGRKQDQPPLGGVAPLLKGLPMRIALDFDVGEVIHAGPSKMLVARQKAGGFDNRGGEPETGAHPQNRARVLRDVWLKKGHRQRRGLAELRVCWHRLPK